MDSPMLIININIYYWQTIKNPKNLKNRKKSKNKKYLNSLNKNPKILNLSKMVQKSKIFVIFFAQKKEEESVILLVFQYY